ncbi:MAG: leucine-rich repeat protein, partial [Treponema sp.]|nr:leucine-rich repeat protein [Treponema sp.]
VRAPDAITSFTIGEAVGIIIGTDITVLVSKETDVTNLSPAVTVSAEASVSPESGAARNFTNPVQYTVTAQDDTQKIYTVTVKTALNSAAEVSNYLTAASGGTGGAPLPLPVTCDLSTTGDTAADIFTAISGAGKYVALDLTDCTGITEFPSGASNGPLKDGGPFIVSLVLPDIVTSIADTEGNTAYISYPSSFTSLKKVSGKGITSIGNGAFTFSILGNTSLEEADFPEVTEIDDSAFQYCKSLTNINFSKATSIGNSAFIGCSSLLEVSFPTVTSIGEQAFYGCRRLVTVSFPEVTSIDNYAFSNCSALPGVSLPKATDIGDYVFMQCDVLVTVNLPKATSIGDSAFYLSPNLEEVNFPEATSIGEDAFLSGYFQQSKIKTVTLPKATSIGKSAFQECDKLETVSLPKATNIGESAFQQCSALVTVTLPKATSIGNYAFSYSANETSASALTTVSLPVVTSIGEGAFQQCRVLTTLTLPGEPPTLGTSVFSQTNNEDTTLSIKVPSSNALSAYESAWNVLANTKADKNRNKYGDDHKAINIEAES